MLDPLREQYERFPYPPVPSLALPRRDQGENLRFETGARTDHSGIRILVAGCGTLEPAVVAQVHPRAREIVGIDLSERSLAVLRKRLALAKISRLGRLPPIRLIHADLRDWASRNSFERFDYILASNVLHHVEDPAKLLAQLSALLTPKGILRVVTYPKASRIWMRETSRWFQAQGLERSSPDLVRRAREMIRSLPEDHPVRSCFLSQPEISVRAGLIDAFFNARENPLSPLEWKRACWSAGLELFAEGQNASSRSAFLDEILPEARPLGSWEKLQILDDFLELCANPVFWLRKAPTHAHLEETPSLSPRPDGPSPDFRAEIKQGLLRAEALLSAVGISLQDAWNRLAREVGPRVDRISGAPLPGLSITDYPLEQFFQSPL